MAKRRKELRGGGAGAAPRSSPRAATPPRPRKADALNVASAVIFGVALALRIVVALQIDALPISREPHYDSLEYLAWGERVAAADFTWPAPPPHGPGYPYFLGAVLALTRGSVTAARIVQSLLGALTCLFVARAGARWFGRLAGLAAGAILAIYAPLIWIDVSILAEGLLITTIAAALWCAATERHPAITGLLLGFAAIVRPTALVLLPLFLVAGAATWRRRALLVAMMCVPIVPVTAANWRTMHAFIPIQAFGGMNSYLGNSPLRDGLPSARPGGDWDRIASDAVRHGAKTVTEEERYFARKTSAEIAAHPGAFVELLGAKLLRTFSGEEIRDTHSFYFFAQFAPLLRWLPGFTILFALAAAGAAVADWRSSQTRYAALFLALSAASTIVLVVAARYRLPMVLPLALFSGIAVARARELGDRRRLVIMAVVALVAGACTRLWPHPPSHNLTEEWAFTSESLGRLGDQSGAERTARLAIATDARSALAWDALGLALGHQGRTAEARDALMRATAMNPDFAAAYLHLGNVQQALGDDDGAVRAYAASAELSPHDYRPVAHLAPLLAKRGDLPGAQRVYARLVELSPGDAGAMMALARIDGALGKPAEGLALAERSAEIRNPRPDEWIMVALLAAQAGKTATARTALERAGEASNSAPGMFIRALVSYREHRLDEAAQILDELLAKVPSFADAQRLRAAVESERAAGTRR